MLTGDAPGGSRAGSPDSFQELTKALLDCDLDAAVRVTRRAMSRGAEVEEVYLDLIQPAMYEIGDRWREGGIEIGEEHLATATAHRLLGILYEPPAPGSESGERQLVLLACVEGERHALGLQMLEDSLERRGLQTMSMGADVPTEALLRAVRRLEPDVVCLSLSMRLQLPTLLEVISGLQDQDLRIAVGGQGIPFGLREYAPWAWSLKELPRVDLLPRPSEILAVLERHIADDENRTFRPEESFAGEAAVEEARIDADGHRARVWREAKETSGARGGSPPG